jgi:hypothetical protein
VPIADSALHASVAAGRDRITIGLPELDLPPVEGETDPDSD